ncbi:hypothetical protein B0T24DRAFT_353427 [Lasiosphaeria ovina]|uniref:Uncharacterized protein n=1 Tax=Lasiosphaeria ovina TaxID=92902 RepID=A0AAE0K316_9PEZI|nr:hypothetical protein B0T24DRAFT_353427 [Lasiosphaeria ovina]
MLRKAIGSKTVKRWVDTFAVVCFVWLRVRPCFALLVTCRVAQHFQVSKPSNYSCLLGQVESGLDLRISRPECVCLTRLNSLAIPTLLPHTLHYYPARGST